MDSEHSGRQIFSIGRIRGIPSPSRSRRLLCLFGLDLPRSRDERNVPIASGMYLAYVETSEGSKILKVGIVQPEQRIDVY